MNTEQTCTEKLSRSETFIKKLRSQTADAHKSLEELPVSQSITSPLITIEGYAHYLCLMADMVADTEKKVFPALKDLIGDIEERRKLHLLQKDLDFLGVEKIIFEPVFSDMENSKAFSLGVMYVVEGSALGGRFILRNIRENLHLEEQGTQYFSGYGNKTGSHWKHFLDMITAYEEQHDCADQIIDGADYAFNAISGHLQKLS